MSILFVLILISALIATAFLIVFIWSVRSGQYDDTYTPSVRMLFNDELLEKKSEENSKAKKQEIKEGNT
jgi:cbb3-type cytochrome oxidase maturation protein